MKFREFEGGGFREGVVDEVPWIRGGVVEGVFRYKPNPNFFRRETFWGGGDPHRPPPPHRSATDLKKRTITIGNYLFSLFFIYFLPAFGGGGAIAPIAPLRSATEYPPLEVIIHLSKSLGSWQTLPPWGTSSEFQRGEYR